MRQQGNWLFLRMFAIPAVTAALLTGCATTHLPPTAQIASAELAVRQAEDGHARDYAPLELRFANDKLQSAKTAVQSGDDDRYPEAGRLADEALADARLADAKSRTAIAEKLETDMQKSLEALRREATR